MHHWLIIVMALLCFIAAGWAYLQISLQSPYWAFLVVFTVLLGLLFFTPFLMQVFLHPLKWLLQRLRFVTGFFSSTQILENPYRYSIVTAALALAIALWIGIGMMVNSFRSSLEEWIYATVPGNVYVELTKNADEYRDAMGIEVLHKIEQLPALEWVDSLQRLRLSWKDQDVTFSIIHLSGMMQRGNLQVLAGDRDFFRPDAVTAGSQKTRKEIRVAVSESYARRHGWNIGELYYLNSPWGRLPLRLGAILYDYTSEQGLIYAEKEDAKSFIPPEKFHAFALFLKEDFLKDVANVKSLIQDLRKWPEFSNKVRVRSQNELIDHAFEIFDQTFQVTEALRVVALFVAFLGVLTTLAILIEEKRRDIGLLQSLGMSPRQVVLYGLLQGLMIAILAFAIGAISGVVLCWLIINLVHYYFFGWTIFFFLDFGLLGQSLLLTLAAGAIASTAGMYYLKKLKLSEALRFDE